MSSRPRITKYPLVVDGDMSLASITSAATIIQDLTLMSYGISWAGTAPVGTIAVQVSNDYSLNAQGGVANAGTWTTLPFQSGGSTVTSLPVTGSPGTGFIDISLTAAYAIRLVYTKTSGTGLLQVIVNDKVT